MVNADGSNQFSADSHQVSWLGGGWREGYYLLFLLLLLLLLLLLTVVDSC